jgi:hypothetical protein
MKGLGLHVASLLFLLLPGIGTEGSVSDDYKGKPFQDATHSAGPQAIPGRLEAALYDLGGEGVAYHDVDAVNHGSGELNYQPGHCEECVPVPICHFREKEGVDISYVKKGADLRHQAKVRVSAVYRVRPHNSSFGELGTGSTRTDCQSRRLMT